MRKIIRALLCCLLCLSVIGLLACDFKEREEDGPGADSSVDDDGSSGEEQDEEDGFDPEGLSYRLNGGAGCYSVVGYSGKSEKVIVPPAHNGKVVTKIGNSAFKGMTALSEVTLPACIKVIGQEAFRGCSVLKKINIPKNVNAIGERAFQDCVSLDGIELNDSLGVIGDYAFAGCKQLSDIVFPDALEGIGEHAFEGCLKLTEITVGGTASEIKAYAFAGCKLLEDVEITEGKKKVCGHAFEGCGQLRNLSLPSSLVAIDDYAFADCRELSEIELPADLEEIGEHAFEGCKTLSRVIMKEGYLREIGERAFADCPELKEIVVRQMPEKIAANAFDGEVEIIIYGEHEYEETEHKEPTCTEGGYSKQICIHCGFEYITEIPAKGHSWDEGVVTKEPTCVEKGVMKYTCIECGATKEEEISVIDHSWDEGTVTTEPTCTEKGIKTYTCTVCGEERTEEVPANGHSWDEGEITKEPTCIEEGVITYTCTVCGETKEEAVPKADHSFGEGETINEPTCTEDGLMKYVCAVCGKVREEVLPALGHSFDEGEITREPTCVKEGILTYTCTRCGEKIEEALPMLDHVWSEPATAKEPTCTEKGILKYHCVNCGRIVTEEIPALGHDLSEWIDEVPATEEAEGVKGHYHCERCGKNFSKHYNELGSLVIAKLVPGSVAKAGETVRFGNYYGATEWIVLANEIEGTLLLSKDIIDARPYNKNDAEITWEDCTLREWLNNEYMDEAFSEEERSRILLTDVANDDNINGTPGGNDTEDKVFLLSYDEARKYFASDRDREAQGNAYAGEKGLSVRFDAVYPQWNGNSCWWLRTPGSDAYTACYVDVDGFVYYGNYYHKVNWRGGGVRPALYIKDHEHDWGEGVLTKAPTCTENGLRTYTCSLCGANKAEKLPALGHDYVDGFCTRCGEAEPVVDVWDGEIAAEFAGGTGAETDPYLVNTGSQLAYLAKMCNEGDDCADTYFKLTGDIDLNGNEWTPIGKGDDSVWLPEDIGSVDYKFRGYFDGNGHNISDMKQTATEYGKTGLFGIAEDAVISGLSLTGVSVNAANTKKYSICGLLMGLGHNVTVSECYVSGNMDIVHEGSNNAVAAGGLVGLVNGNSCVENCRVDAAIKVLSKSGTFNAYAGGMVGVMYENTAIDTCCFTGSIEAEAEADAAFVAGIIGITEDTLPGSVSDCFADGTFTADGYDAFTDAVYIGWGGDTIEVNNNYYNGTFIKNGIAVTESGNAAETEVSNFCSESWLKDVLHWDLDNIWTVRPGDGYPMLRCFS